MTAIFILIESRPPGKLYRAARAIALAGAAGGGGITRPAARVMRLINSSGKLPVIKSAASPGTIMPARSAGRRSCVCDRKISRYYTAGVLDMARAYTVWPLRPTCFPASPRFIGLLGEDSAGIPVVLAQSFFYISGIIAKGCSEVRCVLHEKQSF